MWPWSASTTDHKQIVEVVQTGIARSRILHAFPTCNKLIQASLPKRISVLTRSGRIDQPALGKRSYLCKFQMRIPWV